MKKTISGLLIMLAWCLLAGIACADTYLEVQAQDNNGIYLRAEPLEDGTLSLIMFHTNGNQDPHVVLPETMTVKGETYRISVVDANCSILEAGNGVAPAIVEIPDGVDVRSALYGSGLYLVEAFEVSDAHPTLAVLDGVLFSKTTNTLLCYPEAKQDNNEYRIPDGIQGIAPRAFNNSKLLSVVIPDSVTDVPANPFKGCINLNRIVLSDTHPALALNQNLLYDMAERRLICSISEAKRVVIPEGILTIGDFAFGCRYAQEQIVLPGTLRRIGNSSFAGRSSLRSINLPAGLTEIGERAFEYCSKLEGLTLPDSIAAMGSHAFYQSGLKEVVIPGSITRIPDSAFETCQALEQVQLPENLLEIGNRAFASCKVLSGIDLPSALGRIGDEAFSNSGIQSIMVPDSVTEIGESAFAYCNQLAEAVLPMYLETVTVNLFHGDENLRIVRAPKSVKTIGRSAFYGCTSLEEIDLPDMLQKIGDVAFKNNKALKSLYLSETVEDISTSSFEGCEQLVLRVVSGSIAEGYALKYDMKYELTNGNDVESATLPWLATETPEPVTYNAPDEETGLPVQGEDTWFCTNCGHGNSGNFCVECGTRKPVTTQLCPNCGYAFPEGNSYKFCPNCGHGL